MEFTEFQNESDIKEVSGILTAIVNGNVTKIVKDCFGKLNSIEKNLNSGYVYGVDEDYNVVMMNDRVLDLWINTPYNGTEGFIQDIFNDCNPDYFHRDDIEYLLQMKEYVDLPTVWEEFIENQDNEEEINDDEQIKRADEAALEDMNLWG